MKDLRRRMMNALGSKELFEQAKNYSYHYMDNVQERDVFPDMEALEGLKIFDTPLNKEPLGSDRILSLLHEYGSPATVAQTGRRYFGFVNGGAVPAAVGAKWLSDVWDQNAGLYVISPISSKLESVSEKWLKELFGFDESTCIGLVGGTSTATLCGLAAGRYQLLKNAGWDVNMDGLAGAPKIRVVIGEHAHSTVYKALSLLGFGKNQLEYVPVDDNGAMLADSLPELDERTLLILQAGNVNSGAFDPFEEICDKAKKSGAWVHVDGAFGLWARAAKSTFDLTIGVEKADSWSVDAHKTLNAPYDCGIVLCKHPDSLIKSMQMSGDYIILSEERDGMLYTPEMSRRGRGIELWATMAALGSDGIDKMVTSLCENASLLGELLSENGFEICNDIVFNQVLIRYKDNETTLKILKSVQESGVLWCGGSKWKGDDVIRVSVCSWMTTPEDIALVAEEFKRAKQIFCK